MKEIYEKYVNANMERKHKNINKHAMSKIDFRWISEGLRAKIRFPLYHIPYYQVYVHVYVHVYVPLK